MPLFSVFPQIFREKLLIHKKLREYGVLVKNSDSIICNVEHNYFRKLDFATQLEGNNKEIGIQCNRYYDSNQDWSINPVAVGMIHDFGENEANNMQAANFFPDIIENESQKNIKLNSNMSFIYYSVTEPVDSVTPQYISNNVSILSVNGTNFEEECQIPFDPCGGNPIPCLNYAQDLVNYNSEAPASIIFKYKLNLAQQYRDSGMMEELKQMIEAESGSEWEEVKLPIYIEYGLEMNVNAQDLIDNLPAGDYKNYMQVILDIKNSDLPIDSVGDLGFTEGIAEIAEGSSSISAAARKILELFYGFQYVREAERWEETNIVQHNNSTAAKKLVNQIKGEKTDDIGEILNSLTQPDFLLIPNPSSGIFTIKLLSSTNGIIFIIDMHGKIISEVKASSGGEVKIEKGFLVPGVYTIRLLNSNESYQLNKRIVILE